MASTDNDQQQNDDGNDQKVDVDDEKEEALNTLQSICSGLGRYYSLMGSTDYFDDQGKGLFTVWCEENDMNDKDAMEELDEEEVEPENCLLVDFDEDFPLPLHYQRRRDSIKKKEIYRIIKECAENPDAFTAPFQLPSLGQDLFDSITIQNLQETKIMYREQCPTMYAEGLKTDHSMLFMFAVQRVYKFDYLQTLVDRYDRWRIDHRNEDQENLTSMYWANQPNNMHFSQFPLNNVNVITKQNTKVPYHIFASNCVELFAKRVCPKLSFLNLPYRINDSLQDMVDYIERATTFVANLVQRNDNLTANVCPFQVDICIAVGEPVKVNDDNQDADDTKQAPVVHDNSNNNDSNDDDDEDDSDEDDYINARRRIRNDDDEDDDASGYATDDDIQSKQPYVDYIGNVEEKLKSNNLRYSKVSRDNKDKDIRKFDNLFTNFKNEHKVEEYGDEPRSYLHHKRVVAFVDRRHLNEDNYDDENVRDELFFYEPPQGALTSDIPRNYVPEWFINASRTCLIPSVAYDEQSRYDKKRRARMKKKQGYQADRDKTIGAATVCRGGLVTLSFHVRMTNIIKLFLYWNGQIIRLFPEDIKTVLPLLFVESERNTNYLQSDAGKEDMDELVQLMRKYLIDEYYQTWVEKYPVNE